MDHPVFQNIKSIIIFFTAWVVIAAIHAIVLYAYYFKNLQCAIVDSLVFILLFSFLALSIWFLVNFGQPGKQNLFNILFSHFTSLIVLLLIWIGLSMLILNSIFSDNQVYKTFLQSSIPWRIVIGTFYYLTIVLIYYLIVYYRNLNKKLINETRLERLLKETELNMLKSQINPHFLFNSLNSISSLTITNPNKAQEMIIKLSDFLRYSVSGEKDKFILLNKEIENIFRYLEIEKVRFGNKLQYKFNIHNECSEIQIPVMILQPLYENAIKHAVYESSKLITIKTECKINGNMAEIHIQNNFEENTPSRKGNKLGLKNIRERLKLLYHRTDLLNVSIESNIFHVTLLIPEIHYD